jgi:uncharacterized membrane protein (UPF0182 family)
MRPPTDLPRRRRLRPARSRAGLLVLAAILFVLFISSRGIASFYTDYLWFGELKLTSVWRGVLWAKLGLGVVFTVVFFVLMYVNLWIADRIAPAFRPLGPEEEIVERYHEVVGARGGLVRTAIAGLFALIAGPGAASHWNEWILFRNHVPFHVNDAQFGRDVGFFVFELPFWRFVVGWMFAAIVIVLVVTAVAHYLNGGIRVQTPGQKVTPQVKAHLSVLLGVLALLKAAGYYFQQFELDFSTRGVVQGATYTDVKAQLPALKLLIGISIFAFVLFLVNISIRGWILPVLAVGLWVLTSVAAGAAYPAFIQSFRVNPEESKKEAPYIKRNIQATRAGLNIDVREKNMKNFAYDDKNLTAQSLVDNADTIRNVRLWDPKVLQLSYQRLQGLRTFYEFNDADIDRYNLDNRKTQVLIAARELNTAGVTSSSWVNRHLQFTHGYGAVLSPANAVTPEGDPELIVKDLPPTGDIPIDEPGLYYGENLEGYAIVKTQQAEVDFPQANGTNKTSTYRGTGGVVMNSVIKRAALALRFGDYNAFISGFITNKSRALYVRDIRARVRKVAPFLRYDNDPYPVLMKSPGDQKNRIFWVQDAYTVTNRYPYAEQASTDRLPTASGLNTSFNYVRNSVKVVIDAYNGSMKFYVVDEKDPLLKAYQKAFPKLFSPRSEMTDELRSHLRYPEDLFRIQTNAFGLYHITNPAEFYNKADAWDIAQDPGSGLVGSSGTTATTNAQGVVGPSRELRMDPYYLLMRLPGEQRTDFLILQPFVPTSKDDSRKNLTAFMVAKSDPQDYGQLEVFVMPRNSQVPGPALVDAQINQDPNISQQITLLGQASSGSRVRLGSLLVLPINQSLLFIRPLYLEAERTAQPQFKKAIVVYANRAVMKDTLREALVDLFGAAPETLEAKGGQTPTPGQPTPTVPGQPGQQPAALSPELQQLFERLRITLAAANDAKSKGNLTEFEAKYNEALAIAADIERALGVTASTPSPAPTPSATTTTAPPATTTTTAASA